MARLNWFALLACSIFSSSLSALRCNNSHIKYGDFIEDVYEACGEPDYSNSHVEIKKELITPQVYGQYGTNYGAPDYFDRSFYNRSGVNITEVQVEEWIYHFRRGGIPKRTSLIFENNHLTQIYSEPRNGRNRR